MESILLAMKCVKDSHGIQTVKHPDYTPVCVENEYKCVPSNVLCWGEEGGGGACMQSDRVIYR